jgi:hypothetical protein
VHLHTRARGGLARSQQQQQQRVAHSVCLCSMIQHDPYLDRPSSKRDSRYDDCSVWWNEADVGGGSGGLTRRISSLSRNPEPSWSARLHTTHTPGLVTFSNLVVVPTRRGAIHEFKQQQTSNMHCEVDVCVFPLERPWSLGSGRHGRTRKANRAGGCHAIWLRGCGT